MDEIELKFLDIDKDRIIKKIEALGAEKKYDTQIIEYTFEKEGFSRKDSTKKYLRVRSVGDNAFLAFKGPRQESDSQKRHTLTLRSESVSVSGRPPPHKDTPTLRSGRKSFEKLLHQVLCCMIQQTAVLPW